MPYTQGLQLFTALQMQKVPSKLLIFPDEGHWVLKPQNSVLWYQDVHRLARFLGEKVKAIIAIAMTLAVVATAAVFCDVRPHGAGRDSAPTAIGLSTPVTVQRGQSARRAPGERIRGTERRALSALRTDRARDAFLLEQARARPQHYLRSRQDQGAEARRGKSAAGGGGGLERPAGQHGYRFLGCQRGAHRAARGPRRLAALRQSRRHGVGHLYHRRLLDRSRREGGPVRLPQFPAARPGSRPALCHVRLPLGPGGRPHAAGIRAQYRPARRPPPTSGSSCSPRNSACAISRSTTPSWRSW